jgi:hypothetical protein
MDEDDEFEGFFGSLDLEEIQKKFNQMQAEVLQKIEDMSKFFRGLGPDELRILFSVFFEIANQPDHEIPQAVTHWVGFIRGISLGVHNVDPAVQLSNPSDFDKLLEQNLDEAEDV